MVRSSEHCVNSDGNEMKNRSQNVVACAPSVPRDASTRGESLSPFFSAARGPTSRSTFFGSSRTVWALGSVGSRARRSSLITRRLNRANFWRANLSVNRSTSVFTWRGNYFSATFDRQLSKSWKDLFFLLEKTPPSRRKCLTSSDRWRACWSSIRSTSTTTFSVCTTRRRLLCWSPSHLSSLPVNTSATLSTASLKACPAMWWIHIVGSILHSQFPIGWLPKSLGNTFRIQVYGRWKKATPRSITNTTSGFASSSSSRPFSSTFHATCGRHGRPVRWRCSS